MKFDTKQFIQLNNIKNKVIVILGPTASGKTALSIKLAKKLNGEVVSADSRQVYKGMDLGTGKITKKEMQGIKHHLLDVVSPKSQFTVARFQKMATKAIKDILKRGKTPFLVGGSPFYLYSIIEGWEFPKMKANKKLRQELEKKSLEELLKILKQSDPKRYKTVDRQNKRRVVRAVEIAKTLGKVPKIIKNPQFDCLILGVKKEGEELRNAIKKRLLRRLKQGMIKEVEKLKKTGVSWKKLESFGLEYKWIALFLQKKIGYDEMVANLETDIWRFSKRQMTWFRKKV